MATNTLIATFYSFKGGVGRTLSLVNTAVALTNMGKSVIIWDMDVEAPGIQNIPYFEPLSKKISGGFVDIVSDYKKRGYRDLDEKRFTDYLVTHPENEKLRLLPVGNINDDASYARKFNAIEWEKLFGRTAGANDRTAGYRLFELIRRQLEAFHPDFILIDSRTGYTDIGGVCCVQLPDVVFLVFNYGRQNLRGIRSIHNVLADENRMAGLRAERYYKTFLVASMVPGDRPELREKRRREWKEYNLIPHFEIPYNTEVAFNETVWTAEYSSEEYSGRFVKICKTLVEERDYLLAQGKDERVHPAPIELEREDFLYFSAREFENKTAELFRLMGYEAEVDKAIGASQIDIFLTRKDQIESRHYIVECKDWEKNVDKTVVDEVENNLKSVRDSFSSCHAIIVARKGFTKEAKKHAASLSIKVMTYDELLNNIVNFKQYVSGIKTLYAGTELEKNYVEQDIIVEDSEGAVPVLDFFSQWLNQDGGGHFTLLGDYGTGKTSLSTRLVHDMALKYENDKTENRVPVLINLKDAQKALGLENIIYNHFLKAAQLNVSPETILLLLREGRILLIFDGFDEMATQTNAALTMQNFFELNRAFTGSAKIILTCRTHYFKDRAETEETLKQKNTGMSETSTALYRAIKGKAGYSIGYLQEFSSGQIEMYLKKTLPDTWPDAKRTINNIYNLKDLSARPVLLDMIVKSLPEISNRSEGVQAADLYATYVRIWEERDDWRHELTREGRAFLVEEIAQRLWTQETDRLHYSKLNEVLGNYLKKKKTVVSNMDIELASSEVRTASFLTRDDYGNYGFAHRSFMEFFLARRLAEQLRQGNIECLDIRRLSKEVILFLSRLSNKDLLVKTSQGILAEKYQKQISENALFILYWAVRFTHSPDGKICSIKELKQMFSKARPETINLDRADLDRAELSCMDLNRADLAHAGLSASILSNACLTSANLNNADLSMIDLESADISNASLAGADANHAVFDRSNMEHTDLENANLYAASLVNTRLARARFSNTNLSRAGLLRATIDSNALADQNTCGAGMPHTKPADLDPVILKGHSSLISSVAISPDGKILASGSEDKSIKLWDIATEKEIRSLIGHSDRVYSVAISPDGKTLASGGWDKSIKLWDMKTGKEIQSLIGHSDRVFSVVISPDGKTLASGSGDKSIKLWDMKTGKEIQSLIGHSDRVFSVVISPDGKTLASGSGDKSIKLWDMKTGKEIQSLIGHSSYVYSVVISPDGKTLASGSGDKSIKLWDMKTGKEIQSLIGYSSSVYSVAISPDGKTLASGSGDKSIKLWDMKTGKEIRSLIGYSSSVYSVAISPDGKTLASGSGDKSIKLWDMKTGKEIRSLIGHSDRVFSVVISPDGKTLASGSADKSIKLWDMKTGKEIQSLIGHSSHVFSVVISPDGKTLASGSLDNSIALWDIATGKEIQSLTGHSGSVHSVAISPDGKTLASGGWDQSIKLWDMETGKEIQSLIGHSDRVFSVVISPDGKTLASGSGDQSIKLWDMETGKEIRSLIGYSSSVYSVAISPDGKTLASGSADKSIKLWDIVTGKEIRSLTGHSDSVNSVAISPDGKTLASGGWDQSIKLWDMETGKEIRSLIVHSDSVDSVAISADGKTLAGGTWRGSCLLVEIDRKGKKITELRHKATLWHLPDVQWAALDARNHYVCSKQGRAYISFADRLANYPAAVVPELERPNGLSII